MPASKPRTHYGQMEGFDSLDRKVELISKSVVLPHTELARQPAPLLNDVAEKCPVFSSTSLPAGSIERLLAPHCRHHSNEPRGLKTHSVRSPTPLHTFVR